jgi:hypothetical protein
MFGQWGSDNLAKDWNLIVDKIGSLASSIFSTKFHTEGVGGYLDAENQQIVLFPVDREGNKLSNSELLLSRPELLNLLRMPPIQRGAQIANICEKLI